MIKLILYYSNPWTFLIWLGGAFWVGNQQGCGFWDGLFWLYYVGRYVAAHFTLLTY